MPAAAHDRRVLRRVRKIYEKSLSSSSSLSVCLFARINSAPTRKTLIKFDIFRKSVEETQVLLKSAKNNGCFA